MGNDRKLRLKEGPWIGSDGAHIFPKVMIESPRDQGYFHLDQVVDLAISTFVR